MDDRTGANLRADEWRVRQALNIRVQELARSRQTTMAALSRELRGNRSSLRNMILSKPGPSLHTLLWLAKRLELRSIEELFGDFGSYQAIASVEALTEGQDAGA